MNDIIMKKASGIVKTRHPDYAGSEYFSFKHIMLVRNSECSTEDLLKTLNKYIGSYEENRSRVCEAVRAAIKYGSRVWGVPVIFDEDGYNRLKELRNIVEDSDDNEFIFIFKEKRMASGIYAYDDPTLIVVDIDRRVPLYALRFNTESNKFEVIEKGSYTYFQCFDVYDDLSVGDPFVIEEFDPPIAMHEATEDICEQMKNRYLLKECSVVNVNNADPEKDKELEFINSFKDTLDVRKCRTCNQLYVLTADEKNWYDERQFTYPKSCAYCRHAKREKAREQARLDALRVEYIECGFDE